MNDKIKGTEKMNENEKITAEDLDSVAGGKGKVVFNDLAIVGPHLLAYGGPPRTKGLKELMEEREREKKKKEREKKIEQILKLAREIDEDRSNR